MDSPHAETTLIAGFYNPNSYPFVLSLSAFGLNVTLQPKEFFTHPDDKHLPKEQRRRVNDPALEALVRPGGLGKDVAKTPVPLVKLRPYQAPAPTIGGHGFGGQQGTSGVTQVMGNPPGKAPRLEERPVAAQPAPTPVVPLPTQEGETVKLPPAPAEVRQVSSQFTTAGNPVRGMSIAEARRAGLIKETRPIAEVGIPETTGAPPRGEQIPSIEDSYATDLPRGARPGAPTPKRVPAPRLPAAPVPAAPPVEDIPPAPGGNEPEQQPEPDSLTDLPPFDMGAVTRQILHEVQAQDAQAAAAAPTGEAVPPPPAAAPAPGADAEVAAPPAVPVPPAAPSAPAAQAEAVAESSQGKGKFVCSADGREFPYRSYLKRHIERTYPDRMEELMAPYPESRRPRKKK